MNKYALIAEKAVSYINKGLQAEDAWEKASCEVYPVGSASQKKGCPKNAFLGLFSNDPNVSYSKNAIYAQRAVEILRKNPNRKYSVNELWSLVIDESKTHNSQMNIVLTLWYKKLIK